MNARNPLTTITVPALAAGEINAGLIFTAGAPAHWLIVLPARASNVNWTEALAWAKEQGGELPTRQESALVYANAAAGMETDLPYWTSEPHAGNDAYAWGQWFDLGIQNDWHKSGKARAFAVRRLPI